MHATSRTIKNSRFAGDLRLVAVLIVAEFAVRAAIDPYIGDRHQYVPAYAAIGAATWLCGWRAGIITALACLLSGEVFAAVSTPDGTMQHESIAHAAYVFMSAAIISLAEWRRREWQAAAAATDELREADRRKSEVIALLGHEMRNPLASMAMGSKMLAAGLDPAAASLTLRMVERQTQHMTRLVNDLSDADWLRQGKLPLQREMVDVAAAVQEAILAVRSATDAKQQQVELFRSEDVGAVFADPIRLQQILTQLLQNASQFSAERAKIEVGVLAREHWVSISVEDTGVGMPPSELPRIFDPFVRLAHSAAQTRGLGLGLTLSRELAHLHGGTLRAFSGGIGRGSEFVLTLPRIVPLEQAAVSEKREQARHAGRARSMVRRNWAVARLRILVVDDDADTAATLALLLKLKGHDVLIALNGGAALEIAARKRPRVVFLDIGLPDMSGLDLATKLRELLGAEPALVAVTGWSSDEDVARSRTAGLDAHLTKPVDPAAIDQVLSLLGCAEHAPGGNTLPAAPSAAAKE
jgi:signal transduction histidine kinase/ActR/RegA family two-component response regulator